MDYPIYLIPLLPLLGAAFNLLLGRKLSRSTVHFIAVAAVAASFGVAAWLVAGPVWDKFQGGAGGVGIDQHLYTWIHVGSLNIELAFRIDTLSAVMILVVTFVGTLIHIYSTGYMADEPRYAAYFGYLNLFTGAMLILVLADNLPVMFIGWEGVGLCSYLLIGFWFSEEANANAGRKAFVVNRIGDFAFLLGMFLLFWQVGTLDFQKLEAGADVAFKTGLWGERVAFFAGVLLFIGACGKSAQIPLYVWLPDAMAGPTPVSALIHAATMVTAGVYMVARLSWLYASSATAMAIVAGVGALTALLAAIMAFAQTDFKKVLAYSTVSQLGFMFVGVGVGAYAAGIFHLVTHAFFKAGLFLAAGSVMHAMSGSGDIMKMGGLRKKLPWTHGAFVVYWLAICGVFPFAGFFSKDEILAGAFAAGQPSWLSVYGEILWVVLTLAALGTAFYMTRLYCLAFLGKCRADEETQAHVHESPPSMTVPLIILAVFTVGLGAIGLPHIGGLHNYLGQWLHPSVASFDPAVVTHAGGRVLSSGVIVGLMVAALVIGLIGIGLGIAIYRDGPSERIADATEGGFGARLYDVVYNKFYVDEAYDLAIVRPFRWLARGVFEVIDRFVIDLLLVNGLALFVSAVGRVSRWVQNGQVQRYLAGVLIGAAAIFYFTTRVTADFEQVPHGAVVQFKADIGKGPSAGTKADPATIDWDFDGDGKPDDRYHGQLEPSVPRTDIVGDTVTLWFTDAVLGKRVKVVKKVHDVARGAAPPAGAGAGAADADADKGGAR